MLFLTLLKGIFSIFSFILVICIIRCYYIASTSFNGIRVGNLSYGGDIEAIMISQRLHFEDKRLDSINIALSFTRDADHLTEIGQ